MKIRNSGGEGGLASLAPRALSITLVMLCAGCKVTILGHTVGGVVSESGAYDCPAGEVCEIDVVDIHFRETFEGLAGHPNYRFKGWRKADRSLCGGKTQACSLSTQGFAGDPNLLAILESDERFYLIPEFERTGPVETAQLEFRDDGKSRVFDAGGRVVGSLDTDPKSGRAVGVNLYFRGYAERYVLPLEFRGFGYRVSNPLNDLVYDNPNCGGEARLLLRLPDSGAFFGPVIAPVLVGPEPQVYIMDPVGTSSRSSWSRRWESSERECLEDEGDSRTLPLVPTNATLAYPLTIEGMTDTIIGPVPDSIHL